MMYDVVLVMDVGSDVCGEYYHHEYSGSVEIIDTIVKDLYKTTVGMRYLNGLTLKGAYRVVSRILKRLDKRREFLLADGSQDRLDEYNDTLGFFRSLHFALKTYKGSKKYKRSYLEVN